MNTIKIDSKNAKMIAHRGLSGLERENTNAAFVAAGNRSYFGIETDVHRTLDGKYVVIHDETTERVTDGKVNINVEKSNYADFSELVLPDIDGSTERTDIKIPLLSEYVKICKKYEKKCVLELKNGFIVEEIKEIVEIIKSGNYLENVIFISFSFDNCTNLRHLVPDNDIQFLTSGNVTDELIDKLKAYSLNLDIYYKKLDKKAIEKLHKNGILVNCWTVDGKADAEMLADAGIDFITTNILE